ncbi:Rv3654c family TadE-like protein, partial [Pseudonocardia abyssalis]|uniref:Rv3654c family TadE-like protein n=1 Tax=Pseudonocardia abyssalis TaxID=2792008 RepID=UPI001C4A4F96
MTGPSTGRGSDGGFATVWAAGAVAVLLGLLVVGIELGAGIAARHRAEAAADLGALAAAGDAVHGTAAACARATTIADRMDTRIRSCRLDGWEALVETEADLGPAVLGPSVVTARARAGPAPLGAPPGTGLTAAPPVGATPAPPAPPVPAPADGPSARRATPSGRNRPSSGHGTRRVADGQVGRGAKVLVGRSVSLVVTVLPIGDDRWCRGRMGCLLGRR